MAKEMKPIVRPELVLIAEVKGEPVAFSMTLPDANYALKAAGGRLTTFGLPIGLVKLLLASRRIKRLRLVTLGIKEGYRRRGHRRDPLPGHADAPRRARLQRRRDLLDARGQPPGQPRHRDRWAASKYQDLPHLPEGESSTDDVLLTGGSGFVGGQLAQALVARGDEVVALVRRSSKVEALEGARRPVRGGRPQHGRRGARRPRGRGGGAARRRPTKARSEADYLRGNAETTRHAGRGARAPEAPSPPRGLQLARRRRSRTRAASRAPRTSIRRRSRCTAGASSPPSRPRASSPTACPRSSSGRRSSTGRAT